MGSSGSGNSIAHGVQSVKDTSEGGISIDPLADKVFTYTADGSLSTVTTSFSDGITKRLTFTWLNKKVINIDEEYL